MVHYKLIISINSHDMFSPQISCAGITSYISCPLLKVDCCISLVVLYPLERDIGHGGTTEVWAFYLFICIVYLCVSSTLLVNTNLHKRQRQNKGLGKKCLSSGSGRGNIQWWVSLNLPLLTLYHHPPLHSHLSILSLQDIGLNAKWPRLSK